MPEKEEIPLDLEANGDIAPIDDEASELEALQLNINRKTDESLESTRRMVTLCEESKESAIGTLVMLDEQGEQLEQFEEDMDEIGRDMKEAEEALEGMEKCCGLFTLPWKKKKAPHGVDPQALMAANMDDDGPRVKVGAGGEMMMMSGQYCTRITNDAREDEMEKNMEEVSGMVGNLANMANDMGTEINNQNKMLNRINIKAQSNEVRIEAANKRANNLL